MPLLNFSLAIKPFAGTILGSPESDSSVTEPETDIPDEHEDSGDDRSNTNDEDQGKTPSNMTVLSTGNSRVAKKQQLDEVCLRSNYGT